MAEEGPGGLFESGEPASAGPRPTGILPAQELRAMVRGREILAAVEIGEDQIQPASLDLRLGRVAYRVRASFLPGPGATVRERLDAFGMHEIDLAAGAVLEKGCVYVVPLLESVALKSRVSALANPKSSIGRLDVFTRLITDHSAVFDQVAAGYKGPLFAEVSPRTFSIVARQGSRLNQLRLQRGNPPATDTQLRRLHRETPLVAAEGGAADIDQGIAVTVDLAGEGKPGRPVGWRARRHTDLIDLALVDHYRPEDFWEPVGADAAASLILNPGDFYILASKEAVAVPPDHAAEMRALRHPGRRVPRPLRRLLRPRLRLCRQRRRRLARGARDPLVRGAVRAP